MTSLDITHLSETKIHTESDIVADVTSQREDLSISQSLILVSVGDSEISGTIRNEESSDIDNIISTAGKYHQFACFYINS